MENTIPSELNQLYAVLRKQPGIKADYSIHCNSKLVAIFHTDLATIDCRLELDTDLTQLDLMSSDLGLRARCLRKGSFVITYDVSVIHPDLPSDIMSVAYGKDELGPWLQMVQVGEAFVDLLKCNSKLTNLKYEPHWRPLKVNALDLETASKLPIAFPFLKREDLTNPAAGLESMIETVKKHDFLSTYQKYLEEQKRKFF